VTMQEAIAAAQAGDLNSYQFVYDECLPKVLGFLRRRCPWLSAQERHEIAHDTLAWGWEHLGRYKPEKATLPTWLCWWALGMATNLKRRAQPVSMEALAEFEVEPADPGDGPDAAYERKRETRRLLHLLGQLPKRERHVVILCYLKGHTMAYAQERLHLSKRQVEYALHNGLGRIQHLRVHRRD
jgi:RNA polymerase sigma factor (sigma-70 family)